MENNDKKEFFALLRAGLWNKKPDETLFSHKTDWDKLYTNSKRQAVLGIVLDGIEQLPEEFRPSRPLYLKWCAEVLQIEDENQKLDDEVSNLFRVLKEEGIEPVLLKGQGVARNYKNPGRRSSGDVDIYTGKKNYDKVNAILSIDGKTEEKWSPKHMMYDWHDVEIENHRLIANMAYPKGDRYLRRLIEGWDKDEATYKFKIGDTVITQPPLNFDAVFLLLHSVVHLMGYGVGIRQICDWVMFLHNHRDELDREVVKKYLKKLGLTNSCRIFGALGVKYLGLQEKYLILPYTSEDEKDADFLLEDIWRNGNFGGSGERKRKLPKGWINARIYNFNLFLKRLRKLKRIAPKEAAWLPLWKISIFVRSKSSKLIRRFK